MPYEDEDGLVECEHGDESFCSECGGCVECSNCYCDEEDDPLRDEPIEDNGEEDGVKIAIDERLKNAYVNQACSDFADIHERYRQVLLAINSTLCACRHRNPKVGCNCDIHAAHKLIAETLLSTGRI